jgi:hypothetical protein
LQSFFAMPRTRRRTFAAAAAAAVAALCSSGLAAACGGDDESGSAQPNVRESRFDPADFGAAGKGAGRWFPLEPGTQTVREGRVNRGHRRLTHRVVTTVTDVTKEIDGVRAVAVLDQDIDGGEIAEQAVDYLAADSQGNVWDLGSYTESYEGGEFVNASDARLSGVEGAEPGILVPGNPREGTPAYSQGTAPGEAPGSAQVVKTGESNCVPFKCYEDVLIIGEGSADEPDLSEYKYFAPGVGQIRTEPRSGGEQEVEVLVNLTHLSPRALSELSAEALKLDAHAREVAADVFGRAPAAKRSL